MDILEVLHREFREHLVYRRKFADLVYDKGDARSHHYNL